MLTAEVHRWVPYRVLASPRFLPFQARLLVCPLESQCPARPSDLMNIVLCTISDMSLRNATRHGSNDHCSQTAQGEHERLSTLHHNAFCLVDSPCSSSLNVGDSLDRRASFWVPLSFSTCCFQLSFAVSFHFYPSSMRTLRRPRASNVLLYVDKYLNVTKTCRFSTSSYTPVLSV